MNKKTEVFTPKARLIQILGEQLIKDATVGLLELVKNSYDADATEVQVIMSKLRTPEAKVIIRDNGCGMDTNTFLSKWMSPASGHKEKQKRQSKRTDKLNRLPLGEKGVGRFATQQIGNTLRIITKVKNSNLELLVSINWELFEDIDKDLHDVQIEYEERKLADFKKDESGTILEISNLRSNWAETDIRKISNSLKRLKSPFKGATDFDVSLKFKNCPSNYSKYENLETSDILEKAHYKLEGIVDEQGIFEFEYEFFVPGEKRNNKKDSLNLVKEFGLKIKDKVACGGFIVYLHNYDKSTKWKWLQKSGVDKKDLEAFCGVNIYRDGIRILPYGEKGNDWLDLDNRRIQIPSRRIGNDTIIGLVEINQTENKSLKDKTNREGLIENTAFEHLKKLVLATIQVLENERRDERAKKKRADATRNNQEENSNVNQSISEVKSTLSDLSGKFSRSQHEKVRGIGRLLEQTINKIQSAEEGFGEILNEQKQEKELLFNLAGTGLAAERFTHEFARLVGGANDSLNRLKNLINLDSSKIKKEVDIIYSSLEALRNDIRLLGPMFYVKRVANEKVLDIQQIIQNTLYLQEHWLKKESIKFHVQGETFPVKMREGSCMQIFNNLIDNSIFWLSRKSELDRRILRIIMDCDYSSVFVSDSGSGVTSRYKERIFEPFFSMRGSDGRGLGLYIVKEILEEKNWDIELVTQEDYPEIDLLKGASFKIMFAETTDD